MSSSIEHFSHPNHTLILYDIFLGECAIEEDATCYICQLPLVGSPTYTCTIHDQTFSMHKSCTREEFTCYGCGKTVIGFPTYACTDQYDDDRCPDFFLHKTCATLPKQINHQKHKKHPLTLHPRRHCRCNVCGMKWKLFTYTCEGCNFDVCVFCAFKQRALGHEGHKKHRLTLERKDRQEQELALERREGRQNQIRREKHFIHPNHPLVLIFLTHGSVLEDATCHICNTAVTDSVLYTCSTDDIDCRNFFLHLSCAILPREIHPRSHKQHSVFLELCPDCVCDVCGVDVKKFAYACHVCSSFIVCVFCVYEEVGQQQIQTASYDGYMEDRTLNHFSHPKHPLRLKEDDVIGEDEICHVCNKPVIGSPTYTCTVDDIECESFYLHKSCAAMPIQINHNLDKHLLALLPRPDGCLCAVCGCNVKYAYACDDCNSNVCVFCGFEQRVLRHEGHPHILTLQQREALFKCDACSEEAKDYSYVCTACNFWIHKKCAFAPFIIPSPIYHHHPLSLIYSVPELHRYFSRFCGICDKLVQRHHWLYYCHKCTYFVHMKCTTRNYYLIKNIESHDNDDEPDLVQFPLSSEESLFDLIVTQCAQLQIDFQGEGKNSSTLSTINDDPDMFKQHWSHPRHPLGHLQFTENDDDDDSDKRVLICDGCIQPITVHHPSYYGCIQCEYFLHSFCATKLPLEFPAEAFPFHPNHSLLLRMEYSECIFIKCGACSCDTNGFYYQCETCDMTIDIRCAFLPTRIKHESHKHHSLVQRRLPSFICSVSKLRVIDRAGYACEFCSFKIDIHCAFYSSRIKHKYDDDSHDITLRHPPFFYEGVFYCEICEEQVNNQWWLYHCTKSDHSYHHNCFPWHENVKLGRTFETDIENEKHTLALVVKRTTRRNSSRYVCRDCNKGYKYSFFLECKGCGYLICHKCVITSIKATKPPTCNKFLQI